MGVERVKIRETGSNRVLVFLHGFGGDAHKTFGMMPAFLTGHLALKDWDMYSFGYPTSLQPDLTGVWAADPPLKSLAGFLGDEVKDPAFEGRRLAFIAHSMGGLILQQALVESSFSDRVDHVFLFGVPSGGLHKAKLGRFFKTQVRDMQPESHFIQELVRSRSALLESPKFDLLVVAGLRDEFVPESSSLAPFPARFHTRVGGNHLEMVKPISVEDASVRRIIAALTGLAFKARWSPPTPEERLNPRAIVERAKRLEEEGDRDAAIELLQEHKDLNPYVAGALAGLFKRWWLASDGAAEKEGRAAEALYDEAFLQALKEGWLNAAGYAGINSAFMTLVLDPKKRDEAAEIACQALEAKRSARKADKWRPLVEAEAALHLTDTALACQHYYTGLRDLTLREGAAVIKQAIWISRALDDALLEERLRALVSYAGII